MPRLLPALQLEKSVVLSRMTGLAYVIAIVASDAFFTPLDVRIGMAAHALLIGLLFFHGATITNTRPRAFLWALSLVPVSRILSLSLPLSELPIQSWYWIIGGLMTLSGIFAVRATGLTVVELGLTIRPRWVWLDILGAPLGVVLGFVAYLITRPTGWLSDFAAPEAWQVLLTVTVAMVIPEELVYRGVLLRAGYRALGPLITIVVAVVYAGAFAGSADSYIVLVLAANVLFSLLALRTGSLIGPILSHAALNVSLIVLAPMYGAQVFPTVASMLGCAPLLEGFCP
jgi:membrane protease YdiL (CAAX protease family)